MTLTTSQEISANASKFSKSYVACYKADCEGRPYHAGTLTGIDLGHQVVLVTAKHVLDKDETNPCDQKYQIYAAVNGNLEQLNRLRTGILPLPNGEHLDISVFIPETLEPRNIVDEPIPLDLIIDLPLRDKHYLAACGFPHRKNERKGNRISNKPYGYFGEYANSVVTEAAGYDPLFHFSIKINLKKVYRGDLKEVIAPNPQGISGGPVLLVHDFKSTSQIEPKLAGIVIARDKRSSALVCVRADIVKEIALNIFPVTPIK
ncbi:hypothetical protein MCEMSHM24_03157 [Comamonadaceae bacterium]|uniref:Trypsin-like peptidase domain-containing protein n=1 Tax=Rhodoferax mekongensis TaxID=3068341 RepID=A0ABZ0AZ19_9BURK|nr:hypothetical protein [Rhodoferax sp. TBRC 17307]WNO03994.1 hypothetical protein RAN89_13890 [Rhodoferax sp. TBRC 17307]